MAEVEIVVTNDSLNFVVNSKSGVPSFVKGQPFEVEVNQWPASSKIRKIELKDFKPFEYDPIAQTWVENTWTSAAWTGLSMDISQYEVPAKYLVLPAYPGGGAHNLVKFSIKLTFKNNKTFTVDPILDERPT